MNLRAQVERLVKDVDVEWTSVHPAMRPFVLYEIQRFNRSAARHYMHMTRWRACRQRTCLRCAWKRVTGQFRREKRYWLEKHQAMRATSSWWPLEPRTLGSGRTYRVAVPPFSYEDYQAWLAHRDGRRD